MIETPCTSVQIPNLKDDTNQYFFKSIFWCNFYHPWSKWGDKYFQQDQLAEEGWGWHFQNKTCIRCGLEKKRKIPFN